MNQLSDLLHDHPQIPITPPAKPTTPTHFDTPDFETNEPKLAPLESIVQDVEEIIPSAPENTTEPEQTPTPKKELDIAALKRSIYHIKDQLDGILTVLDGNTSPLPKPTFEDQITLGTGDEIVEGVFNGEKMIGPDGKEYAVPPNYASKSKLVEGDMMKLTIKPNGKFLYKQTGPTERKRLIGTVVFDQESQKWTILVEGVHYKILTASATFYKAKPGDEAVILVPEGIQASWGAVENVISK